MAPLRFEGVAHPPPIHSRKNVADLSRAEIATTNMGKTNDGGTSLLVEHDHTCCVGKVHASWESPIDGSLRVLGIVHDTKAATAVRDGELRGLSLGTGVTLGAAGNALMRTQEELSLCAEPRRGGCWIDRIDGRAVRETACFSGKRNTHGRVGRRATSLA